MTKVRFQSLKTPLLLLGRLSISSERAPKDVQAWELTFLCSRLPGGPRSARASESSNATSSAYLMLFVFDEQWQQ